MSKKYQSKSKFLLKQMVGTVALALIGIGFIGATVGSEALAQDASRNNSSLTSNEGRQFSAKAGETVTEALQFINANQHSAALSKLSEALSISPLNAYERSTIYQMQGASYYELGQYAPAISAFQNAIKAGGLSPTEANSLHINIAQLMIANGQYTQGTTKLESLQQSQYIEMLLMQACVLQFEKYSCALPWAEKWFDNASPKERKHFDLMNFLYNNLGQQGRQADIVKQMINRWPEDKTLWDAWASMLSNGGREQEAFEVTKMLYLGGALNSEDELMKVVQYYSFYSMPYQAAEILEKEMNANRISRSSEKMVQLSSLFRQAREYERAIPVLEQAAASSGQRQVP